MTYLELINKVLIRLREPEVTSPSSQRYSKLIGALVNEAKRAVEDAADWSALLDTLTVTTAAGTSEYTLTGANERSTVMSVTNEADRAVLKRCRAADIIKLRQINSEQNKPTMWTITGAASGALKISLFPIPDAVYSLSVNCVLPQDDLEDAADTISIPWEPVVMRAYAYAIKERGEDQGNAFGEALDQYRRNLSRYLMLNSQAKGGGGVWQVR